MRIPNRLATVLVTDGGGRGDVLAEAYAKSPHVGKVVLAPGNGFAAWKNAHGKVVVDPDCDLKNADSIIAAAERHGADHADIAQDDAVASDAVRKLHRRGIRGFGPTAAAGKIESDKCWQREFADRCYIPVPVGKSFARRDLRPAQQYLIDLYRGNPQKKVWVKAAGLCAGKGALRVGSLQEGFVRLAQLEAFGAAGETFLIEEHIEGAESSHLAIADGTITDGVASVYHFKTARDHKTIGEDDAGEMTGGMGAVAPAALIGLSSWIGAHYHLIDKALKGLW